MPSMRALRESKERCKSVLHKIRAWPVFQHRATGGGGPNIESRGGRLNRNGDVDNGQFADSLLRLMHRRDQLLDPYAEESVHAPALQASLRLTERERMLEEEQRWGQSHELSKKDKRDLNLLPGSEPIVVAAYHLVRRLVRERKCHCCSHAKDKDKDRHRHDSCVSQSVRLIDDRASVR